MKEVDTKQPRTPRVSEMEAWEDKSTDGDTTMIMPTKQTRQQTMCVVGGRRRLRTVSKT